MLVEKEKSEIKVVAMLCKYLNIFIPNFLTINLQLIIFPIPPKSTLRKYLANDLIILVKSFTP
jgi:hypothetical protein